MTSNVIQYTHSHLAAYGITNFVTSIQMNLLYLPFSTVIVSSVIKAIQVVTSGYFCAGTFGWHIGHALIKSSKALLIPGHQTAADTLDRHF